MSELKAIHSQRIRDEEVAATRARDAEVEARRAETSAREDAERARIQCERDERVRVEEARAAAEREARLRVEASEATERMRLAARLDEARLEQEMALRREEVAKQRPRWMVAVTGVAVAATVLLAGFAITRGRDADAAAEAQRTAQTERQHAMDEARAAMSRLEQIQTSFTTLDAKVAAAEIAVNAAQTAADRQHAVDGLREANRLKAEAKRNLDNAKLAHDKWVQDHGIHNDNCLGTPLGCMDK